jgi:hypothetical protein
MLDHLPDPAIKDLELHRLVPNTAIACTSVALPPTSLRLTVKCGGDLVCPVSSGLACIFSHQPGFALSIPRGLVAGCVRGSLSPCASNHYVFLSFSFLFINSSLIMSTVSILNAKLVRISSNIPILGLFSIYSRHINYYKTMAPVDR